MKQGIDIMKNSVVCQNRKVWRNIVSLLLYISDSYIFFSYLLLLISLVCNLLSFAYHHLGNIYKRANIKCL